MRNRQAGQAVLIVLLSMVVVLTVVLSVIASSTSDIKISSNETTSLRAFSAAESGIEKALISNSSTNGNVNSGASFNANVSGLAFGQNFFVYPTSIVSGDTATFWFVSHSNTNTLVCNAGSPCFTGKTINICWGVSGTSANSATTPAIEISAYYLGTPGDYTTIKFVKGIYDPNVGRLGTNGYTASDPGSCTVGTTNFAFQKQIDLSTLGIPVGSYGIQNGLQFMTVKMLYNTDIPHSLGVNVNFAGNSTLPSQGNQVDSTGSLNGATRKIEVTKSYNQIPPVFDSAIFSPSNLSQ